MRLTNGKLVLFDCGYNCPRRTTHDLQRHPPASGRVASYRAGRETCLTNQSEPGAHGHSDTLKRKPKTEKLLWSILRGKQVCGLRFRRQHPIGPFFADFACVGHKLAVEIDGPYHDTVVESDLSRDAYIQLQGWKVVRFSDADVDDDPEAVASAIAQHCGLEYEYQRRAGTGSGMENVGAPNKSSKRK